MMCAWKYKDVPNPCQSNKKGKDTLGYQNFVQNSSGFFDLEDLQHDSMTSRFLKQPWPTKIIWCWIFKVCFPSEIADCSWQHGWPISTLVNQNSAWNKNRWQDSKFVLMKIMNSQPQKHHKTSKVNHPPVVATKPTGWQPPCHASVDGWGILERLRGAPRPCEGGWLVRLEDASLQGGGFGGRFGGGEVLGEGMLDVCAFLLGGSGMLFRFFFGGVVGDGLFFLKGLEFKMVIWNMFFFGWLNGWKGMRVRGFMNLPPLNNRWIASWRVELTQVCFVRREDTYSFTIPFVVCPCTVSLTHVRLNEAVSVFSDLCMKFLEAEKTKKVSGGLSFPKPATTWLIDKGNNNNNSC